MAEKKNSSSRPRKAKAASDAPEADPNTPAEKTAGDSTAPAKDDLKKPLKLEEKLQDIADDDGMKLAEEQEAAGTKASAAPDRPESGTQDDETPDVSGFPDAQPGAPASEPVTGGQSRKSGGVLPMLLGGLVAGGIGFGAAYFGLMNTGGDTLTALRDQVAARSSETSERLDSLSADIQDLTAGPDMSTFEQAQAELRGGLDKTAEQIANLQAQMSGLETRITELEKRPVTSAASDTAVAAYERELQGLQAEMAKQREEIAAKVAQVQEQRQDAEATEQAAKQRAALSRIRTALDNGQAYAPALAELEATGLTADPALGRLAKDGVPTLAELQTSYPDAARNALAASRKGAQAAGEGGGFSGFLRSQLGMRSLTPREGNDPDAVLSRAEHALSQGNLETAMSEIGALPEAGRDAMADWVERAENRKQALAAMETLAGQIN